MRRFKIVRQSARICRSQQLSFNNFSTRLFYSVFLIMPKVKQNHNSKLKKYVSEFGENIFSIKYFFNRNILTPNCSRFTEDSLSKYMVVNFFFNTN